MIKKEENEEHTSHGINFRDRITKHIGILIHA